MVFSLTGQIGLKDDVLIYDFPIGSRGGRNGRSERREKQTDRSYLY
jgi:hypothetical protein